MPSLPRVTTTAPNPWRWRSAVAAATTAASPSTGMPVASANSVRFGMMMSAPPERE